MPGMVAMDSMSTRRTPALLLALAAGCSSASGGSPDAAPSDAAKEAAVDAPAEAAACNAPNTLCAGQCVDTQRAFRHCGQCGRQCSGAEICVLGSCTRAGVCPTSCSRNEQCRSCVFEGDPTRWCCRIQGSGSSCYNNGSQCPAER